MNEVFFFLYEINLASAGQTPEETLSVGRGGS